MFICAYFPFSRFIIRSRLFVPIVYFLGLELGCCVHLCLFSYFLGLELGCVHLCLFSIFSVWN